ncbi:phosphodiester glycosidase family protein, partial [Conexibacter sp. CPCC 206217]|uniref:phosphodiester glycosidase family protein n=1 Tax=Conexibacter sp. CPCC 206217 TaxID=3064574 RepID=UPI00271D15B9
MTPSSPRHARRRGRLPAALLAGVSLAAAIPTVAQAADSLALTDKTEQVGPGISLQHLKTLDARGWVDEQILTVDLANRAVTPDLLAGDTVTSAGPISKKADKAGAFAGVNGDFFDIDNSNAALGAEVRSGELLKSTDWDGHLQAGVTRDGIGQLVDMAVDAHATFSGSDHTVRTINAANGGGLPADSLVAFTSKWGTYARNRGMLRATNVAEVLVQNGKVVSVNATGAGAGEIPADGFYLVGRDSAADALRALQPGDDATLTYGLSNEIARQLQFSVGGNVVLVRDGAATPQDDTSIAPRTAIGFKDGGRTMLLVTWDGPGGTGRGGVTLKYMATELTRLGSETALNLDGGGSTTMVARGLGDDRVSVRNVPSDGGERNDPNGVGVFVKPGSGIAEQLVLSPSDDDARVFPGLHRTLRVKAVDDNMVAVPVPRGDVRWSVNEGSVDGGLLKAPENVFGQLRVRATTDTAQAEQVVRVLGELTSLEIDRTRLSIAAPGADNSVVLRVTGRDAEGFTAPVSATDLDLDYDDSVVSITPVGDQLRITPKAIGGTLLTLSVGGEEVQLPITIGVETSTVYDFQDGGANTRWITNGTAGTRKVLTNTPEGLQLEYGAARNMGFGTRSLATDTVPLPGQPLAVRIRLKSSVPVSLTYAVFRDPAGTSVTVYGPAIRGSDQWQTVEFTPPPSTRFPVRFSYFQAIETNVALQRDGVLVFGGIEIDNPPPVEIPGLAPLKADPIISPDGNLQDGEDFTFATLSDVQFTHVNTEMVPVAIQALRRIRATRPDLVVLNGDIVDLGEASDISLARRTLEAGGCRLIELGTPTVPDPTDDSIPCLYVPGNHESYAPAGQGTLDAFRAEFGRDYGYTDHKGTRFITLNSSYGSLRSSDFAQLPYLQQALTDAAADDSIDNVMVFAHHPVLDPRDTHDSELGDRTEVQL